MGGQLNETEVQRAWDALVHEVIDAKEARPAVLSALVAAQQEEGRVLNAMQPFLWRGEPVPAGLLDELEDARAVVAERQRDLDAAIERVVVAQAAMKAGDLDKGPKSPKTKKGK